VGVHIETPTLTRDNKVPFHPSMLQQPFNFKVDKQLEDKKAKQRLREEHPPEEPKVIEID